MHEVAETREAETPVCAHRGSLRLRSNLAGIRPRSGSTDLLGSPSDGFGEGLEWRAWDDCVVAEYEWDMRHLLRFSMLPRDFLPARLAEKARCCPASHR